MQWMNSLAGINYWGSYIEKLEKVMVGFEWFIRYERNLVDGKDRLHYEMKVRAVESVMHYMARDIVRKNDIYKVINSKDHSIWNEFKNYTEEELAGYQISIPSIQQFFPKIHPLLLKCSTVPQ